MDNLVITLGRRKSIWHKNAVKIHLHGLRNQQQHISRNITLGPCSWDEGSLISRVSAMDI